MKSTDIQNRYSSMSKVRWFRHLFRMPRGHLPVEVFQAHTAGRRHWDRPRIRLRDYISRLAWECDRILQEKLENVARLKAVWSILRDLLPHNLTLDKWK